MSSTPCQSTPHQIIRAKGFSRKYFNRLPYYRFKKHTAESPAVAQLISATQPPALVEGRSFAAQDGGGAGAQGLLGAVVGRRGPPGRWLLLVSQGRRSRLSQRGVFGAASCLVPFCTAVWRRPSFRLAGEEGCQRQPGCPGPCGTAARESGALGRPRAARRVVGPRWGQGATAARVSCGVRSGGFLCFFGLLLGKRDSSRRFVKSCHSHNVCNLNFTPVSARH